MRKKTRLWICLWVALAAGVALTGCDRGNGQGVSQSTPAMSGIQAAPADGGQPTLSGIAADPTLSAGLDQIDSQLNDLGKSLDGADSLDEFK